PRWHALPVLGNALEVVRPDFHRLLLEWANKYGGIYRVKVLWMEGLVVTDPAAVAAICGRGAEGLDKADIVYSPINQMCTPRAHPNLLTSPADNKWKAVRKAVAVSFSANNIRKKFPVSISRQIAGAAHVDVDQAALRVTLDVIGLAAFSHNFGSTELGPPSVPAPYTHLLRVLPRCFTEVMLRVANPLRALAPSKWRGGEKGQQSFFDFHAEMRMLLHKCLARTDPPDAQDVSIGAQLWRLYHESQGAADGPSTEQGDAEGDLAAGGLPLFQENPKNCKHWMHPLISCPPLAGKRGAERIMSEIGILFVEGFETTGHTISWTLLKVATTPDVQDRIAAELDDLGLLVSHKPAAPGARPLALDDLPSLKYLTACIKESMRMLPVVSIMGRYVVH
ncbi:cytochrome P450, partial [Dunaliella salina]